MQTLAPVSLALCGQDRASDMGTPLRGGPVHPEGDDGKGRWKTLLTDDVAQVSPPSCPQ